MSAECEFIQQVEGAFHYPKEQDYFDVLETACVVSLNSALLIAYETALAGEDEVPKALRRRLVKALRESCTHPLMQAVLPVLEAVVEQGDADSAQVHQLLDVCEQHPGAEYALNLAFFSCFDAEIDFRCEDIRAAWEEKDTIVTTGGESNG